MILETQRKNTRLNRQLSKEKACENFENFIIIFVGCSTYHGLEEVLVQGLLANFVGLQGTGSVTDLVQGNNSLQNQVLFLPYLIKLF